MRLLLLVPLLAVQLSMILGAKWGVNKSAENMCERNITGYRKYIDGLFNVPMKKLADILLGDQMYTTRYKNMQGLASSFGFDCEHVTSSYLALAKDIHDEVATPWIENQNGWIQRQVTYGRHVHDNTFVKHADTALYQDEQLILSKRVRNLDTFIQSILIEVEYCGFWAGRQDTYIEVDVKLTVDGTLLSFFDDSIMESSHQGFVATYDVLQWLLKDYVPQHPGDPLRISIQPTTKQSTSPYADSSNDKSVERKTLILTSTVDPVRKDSRTWFKIFCLILGAAVLVAKKSLARMSSTEDSPEHSFLMANPQLTGRRVASTKSEDNMKRSSSPTSFHMRVLLPMTSETTCSVKTSGIFNGWKDRNNHYDDESTFVAHTVQIQLFRFIHTSLGNLTFDEVEGYYKKKYFKIASPTTPLFELTRFVKPGSCDQIFYETEIYISSTLAHPPNVMPDSMKKDFLLYGMSHCIMVSELWLGNIDFRESMQRAFASYPPKKLTGIVFDSSTPWLESIALYNGAEHVISVRRENLTIEKTRKVDFLDMMTFVKSPQKFYNNTDFVANYFTLAMYGLGRVGGSLDPWGDLTAMLRIRCLLKDGGLVYLSLPRGQDTVIFNLYRVYGRIRLPMLFEGFEILATFRADSRYPVKISYEDYDHQSYLNVTTIDTYVLKKLKV